MVRLSKRNNAALCLDPKESNRLEDVESGLLHTADSVYTEYRDPRRDEWRVVREALTRIPLKVFEKETGKPRRMLIDARKDRDGRTRGIDSYWRLSRGSWVCSARSHPWSERASHAARDIHHRAGARFLQWTCQELEPCGRGRYTATAADVLDYEVRPPTS